MQLLHIVDRPCEDLCNDMCIYIYTSHLNSDYISEMVCDTSNKTMFNDFVTWLSHMKEHTIAYQFAYNANTELIRESDTNGNIEGDTKCNEGDTKGDTQPLSIQMLYGPCPVVYTIDDTTYYTRGVQSINCNERVFVQV